MVSREVQLKPKRQIRKEILELYAAAAAAARLTDGALLEIKIFQTFISLLISTAIK